MADIYSENAERFFAQYHWLDFKALHTVGLPHLRAPQKLGDRVRVLQLTSSF